jgi:integrase/recombinase XerD
VGAQSLEELTPDVLRAYFLALRERRNATGVDTAFRALRAWLKWAWREYDLPGTCPIEKVRVAAPKAEPKPAIPLDDLAKLLEACTGQNEKRDRALLLFLVDTGVRRRELCELRLSALHKNGAVHLAADGTKTGAARTVFLSRDTQKALKAYLATRGELDPGAALFATDEGEAFTVSGLRHVIRRRCKAAGIPETGLHAFRRTFAIESLRAGADVVSVSRLLGHSKVETTKRYLPQNEDDLREVHARTSPVSRLKGRRK